MATPAGTSLVAQGTVRRTADERFKRHPRRLMSEQTKLQGRRATQCALVHRRA